MVTPTWHILRSALCCLLLSSAVSIASRLALAAKLLLQTTTKEYNAWHAEGFVKSVHYTGADDSDTECLPVLQSRPNTKFRVVIKQ